MKLEEALKLTPVVLANASELYQPVFGTSAGSVYYVIAVGPDINVAARLKNSGEVSVRAEGKNLSKCADRLKAAGMKASEKHYSLHLAATTPVLQAKAVGALLLSLGIKFNAVISRPVKLVGLK